MSIYPGLPLNQLHMGIPYDMDRNIEARLISKRSSNIKNKAL